MAVLLGVVIPRFPRRTYDKRWPDFDNFLPLSTAPIPIFVNTLPISEHRLDRQGFSRIIRRTINLTKAMTEESKLPGTWPCQDPAKPTGRRRA